MQTSFLQQLWNKGIDISAGILVNAISALIIAIVATVTWRGKRRRDLKLEEDKQRQAYRIASEFELAEADKHLLDLQAELVGVVEGFRRGEEIGSGPKLQQAWDEWIAWLEKHNLKYLPENQKIISSWTNYSDQFAAVSNYATAVKFGGGAGEAGRTHPTARVGRSVAIIAGIASQRVATRGNVANIRCLPRSGRAIMTVESSSAARITRLMNG